MMIRLVTTLGGLCTILVSIVSGQSSTKLTPERAARAIVGRIVHETSFELQLVPQKSVLDIQVVDFDNAFGTSREGTGCAFSVVHVEKDTTILFGISRALPLTIRLNDATVYTASNPTPFVFKEIGYELFKFNDSIRLPLKKGENRLLVKGRLSADRNVVYLRELAQPRTRTCSRFDLAGVDSSLDDKAWAYIGVFRDDHSNLLDVTLPPESGYKRTYSFQGAEFAWRFPPAQMIKELRIKPDAVYRRESYAEWQYPNGTVMLSLLDFGTSANDTSAITFVKQFCTFTLDNLDLFKKQYERLHAFRGTNHKLIRRGMLDDTGAPALPFVELLIRTHDRRLEPIVFDVVRYIVDEQLRLGDGTFCRYERAPGTVWADDLFMSAPFMVRLGHLTGENRLFDDAARQVVNFNKYLEDGRTGLYRHGWHDLEKRQSSVAWGRANGWVIWATSEVLRYLPTSHPLRGEILNIYRQHLRAIVAYQAPSGLWHQVLDRPDSYEETSCTAMFIIGLARGIRMGVLDDGFMQPLKNAWLGLQTRISGDGIVKDICRGTEMSDEHDYYFKRERFDNDPRGLGAVITACVEMMHFETLDNRKQ